MTDTPCVLVADDDRGVRSTTVAMLQKSGFQVVQAEDGLQTLTALASADFDAVVLDVKMPGKDGITVLDDMVPQPPPPGVLLVSAYDIDYETRRRLESRVHTILRKPVPPSRLIEAVTEAIEVARAARS